MIYLATTLLFTLAVVTVYAIIQTGKHRLITFFLIPLVLISSLYTGYTIYALQGTPINGIPEGEVEVIWSEVQKPHIFYMVRKEGETKPLYFALPYTKENAKKFAELEEQREGGQVPVGEFRDTNLENKGSLSRNMEIEFDDITRTPLPPKKKELKMQGVDQRIINEIHNNTDEAPI
jgi:hypothetical protein